VTGAAGAIVSCADGKITDVSTLEVNGRPRTRISIFLNVFNVHVNRSPVSGVVTDVTYQRGKFQNAMGETSADNNEQNICTVLTDDNQTIVFKQIAGLLARRIVFNHKVGDRLERGQRVGLIKFGSRCDLIFSSDAKVSVKVGDKVSGGSSVLAILPESSR
jgi:phosphatidylserine decarboxylase